MDKSALILVVAQSGRMLAAQLVAQGHRVLVIDCFADEDMQLKATDFRQVENLALSFVEPAFDQLFAQYRFTSVLYGSGLEQHIETLAFLERHSRLLGNSVDVFQALQQKKDFFQCLDHFGISYPAVQFNPPATNPEKWLFKAEQGEGGVNVFWANQSQLTGARKKGYWQRYISGKPMSVLFLADGKQGQIIGVHRQLTEGQNDQPFLFAGVIAEPDFSVLHRRQLQRWRDLLADRYNLIGLNSLDFILADDKIWLLEINARPSASLQLYSAELVSAHIAACLGKNDEVRYNKKIYNAYKIVFADCALKIPPGFFWPEWVCDRPVAQARIAVGQPLCSLVASGDQVASIIFKLAVKERQLIDTIKTGGKCNFERV